MRTFKTEITVAVSTESPGQTPGLVKSPKQNKTQFTSPIKMQNDKVIDMLRDKGLLKTVAEGETNPVSKEKML